MDSESTAELAQALQALSLAIKQEPRRDDEGGRGANIGLPGSFLRELDPWDPADADVLSIRAFFVQFERVAADLPDATRVRLLRARLRGDAQRFVNDLELTPPNEYESAKTQLIAWYGGEDAERAAAQLAVIRKRPEETVRNFAERVLRTSREAAEAEGLRTPADRSAWVTKKATKAFIRGLPQPLRTPLIASPPADLRAALRVAEELSDSLEPETEGVDFLGNVNVECYACRERGHVARNCPQKGDRPTRSPPTRSPVPSGGLPIRQCMFCGEKGHLAIDCTRMIALITECAFCGIRGHTDEDCYKKKRILGQLGQLASSAGEHNVRGGQPAAPVATAPNRTRRTVGLVDDEPLAIESGHREVGDQNQYPVTAIHGNRSFLTVGVALSGCSRRLVIDTGAAVSVLSAPVPGVAVRPCGLGIWGADGRPLELLGSQELQVQLGSISLPHRFYVLKASTSGLDLLGMDLLERLPITIRADKRQAAVRDKISGKEVVVSALLTLPLCTPSTASVPTRSVTSRPAESPSRDATLGTVAQDADAAVDRGDAVVADPADLGPAPVLPSDGEGVEACRHKPNSSSETDSESVHMGAPSDHSRWMQIKEWQAEEEEPNVTEAWWREDPSGKPLQSLSIPTIGVVGLNQVTEIDETFPTDVFEPPQPVLSDKINHILGMIDPTVRGLAEPLLQEFKSVFDEPAPQGCKAESYHVIDTGNSAPVNKRPYPIPHALRPVVREQVNRMLQAGVIRCSRSPWNAPVVMVRKKSEPGQPIEWRFCTDFRGLNQVTKQDAYPIPNLQDTIAQLGACRYFSTLDGATGYHQLRIAPSDCEKTAFTVENEHYEYVRMAFGLSGAPASFQREMNRMLGPLVGRDCLVYLDDIIVFSADLPTHIARLRRVLERCREFDFRLNFKKCRLLKREVRFLGHVISESGVRMEPEKVLAVAEYPAPRTVRHVLSFLGLAGFYRRFVPGFSEVAAPLTRLLRKDEPFRWGAEQAMAFARLKQALQTEPVLAYPDFSQEFILATDASGTALGAVLSQRIGGEERPIAYASRALNPAETRYSTTERELLAVVWATGHFQQYLLGRHFQLETDHHALTAAMRLRDPTSRIGRWILRLTEYSYTARYRPGARMGHADGLSRSVHSIGVSVLAPDLLMAAQAIDPWVRQVRAGGNEHFKEVGGVCCRLTEEGPVPLIPPSFREWIIRRCHEKWAGHPAVDRTAALVRRHGYWPHLVRDVRELVRACEQCQARTTPARAAPPVQRAVIADRPGQIVGVDFVGPIQARNGARYVLTAVDHFSKYAEAYVTSDCSAATVAGMLARRYIPVHGVPEYLVSDRGTAFTSALIKRLCGEWGISRVLTSAYHPQGNGVCERFHRTLADTIAKLTRTTWDWERVLPVAVAAYRNLKHASTGYSPNFLTFGREIRLPGEVGLPTVENTAGTTIKKLQEARRLAKSQLVRAMESRNTQINGRRTLRQYEPGDRVYVRQMVPAKPEVRKFWSPWVGPWTVTRQTTPVNYEVRDPSGRLHPLHLMRLKPAFEGGVPDEAVVPVTELNNRANDGREDAGCEPRQSSSMGQQETGKEEWEEEDDPTEHRSTEGNEEIGEEEGAGTGLGAPHEQTGDVPKVELPPDVPTESPRRYNLRERPRPDYRRMHEGTP